MLKYIEFKHSLVYFDMSRPSASAGIFYAIADPTRHALLDQLQQGEQSVTQLAQERWKR